MTALSPLRYPGAKRALLPVIERHVAANPPRLFVEPFAGGASTTLALLVKNAVDHAIIADADPLVAGFWQAAAFRTEELVDAICAEPVTLERWDYWRAAEPNDVLGQAVKCLFLNRTSFSGILHGNAGPIGGRAQNGPYRIDCRWNAGTLAERIRAVGDLATTGQLLEVWCCDWQTTLKRIADEYCPIVHALSPPATTFVYLDPPYVEKSAKLYATSFDDDDHRELAELLAEDHQYRWALSYGDHPLVRQLYAGRHIEKHQFVYSARGSRTQAARKTELLIVSDAFGRLPDGTPRQRRPGPGRLSLPTAERLARRRESRSQWGRANREHRAAYMRAWRNTEKTTKGGIV